jgi:predicted secreted protein
MSFVFDIAAGQAANATGKYNQAVQNRNATIAEQEAAMVEKQLEFDIGRFDQQFAQLQGQTKTSIYKSPIFKLIQLKLWLQDCQLSLG